MFNLLRTFMAVYETRSFSLAAEHLFTSQPTVSHHIQQLEHELNVTLFERNKRSATVPTAAADILYDFSGNMLAEWDKTKQALQNTTATTTVTSLRLKPRNKPSGKSFNDIFICCRNRVLTGRISKRCWIRLLIWLR